MAPPDRRRERDSFVIQTAECAFLQHRGDPPCTDPLDPIRDSRQPANTTPRAIEAMTVFTGMMLDPSFIRLICVDVRACIESLCPEPSSMRGGHRPGFLGRPPRQCDSARDIRMREELHLDPFYTSQLVKARPMAGR